MPQIPVTTASTELASVPAQGGGRSDDMSHRFLLKNRTRTASVFLEVKADAAAAATSFEWEVTDPPLEIELEPGESLKGIVASVTQTVHVLEQGR